MGSYVKKSRRNPLAWVLDSPAWLSFLYTAPWRASGGAVTELEYPQTLTPDGFEVHIIDEKAVQVPVVHIGFKKWQGEPIKNTFGGKGLIDFNGQPMFAELAIKHLAELGSWEARWVETYAMKGGLPYYFSEWGDMALPQQKQDPITNKNVLESMDLIAQHNKSSYYGCWDVVTWNKSSVIYIEAKRTKYDRVRPTQDRWLEAGVRAGFHPNNFMVAWWDFTS